MAPSQVWSEEEHKQFLIGHEVGHHNKGKWKLISAQFVPSKSPTQIASHGKKYFNRQDFIRLVAAANNRKMRNNMHDTPLDD